MFNRIAKSFAWFMHSIEAAILVDFHDNHYN